MKRLQKTKTGFGDQRATIIAHAADRFRHPGRVAREQLVIFGRAQEADDPQLDDEIVDDLLRLLLGEGAGLQVALKIDIEESRRPPQ